MQQLPSQHRQQAAAFAVPEAVDFVAKGKAASAIVRARIVFILLFVFCYCVMVFVFGGRKYHGKGRVEAEGIARGKLL